MVGRHEHGDAQVIGGTVSRLTEQEPAVECLERHRRALLRIGGAELGREPRSMGEDDSAQNRVASGAGIDRGRSPCPFGVALGKREQRVEQRGLQAQLSVGSRSGVGQLAREQLYVAGVAAEDHVIRGKARKQVHPARSVAGLAERVSQPRARVGPPGVERGCRQVG